MCPERSTIIEFIRSSVRRTETLKKGILYLLLVAGGLWHVIGVLQETMATGASLAIAGLSLWLIYEYMTAARREGTRILLRLAVWMSVVFSGSIFIEYVGVQTNLVFGAYRYGTVLKPSMGSVPVAIGFAWLNMLLTSIAVAEQIRFKPGPFLFIAKAVLISVLMVLFDMVMEPAAVKLGYWTWEGGIIPLQNYLAWFTISFIFVMTGFGAGLFKSAIPTVTRHGYYAQFIYFVLVNLK